MKKILVIDSKFFMNQNMRSTEDTINEIIEFYYRFIFYLEEMIEAGKEKGYNLISIMGP